LIYKAILILLSILTLAELSLAGGDSLQLSGAFGKFQNAVSVSASREEFIFVSDLESNKIYKFSKEGKELASFGGTGLGANELNQPYSIDASNGLDVLVADYQNNRIKRLDINLNFILSFDFNSYNLTAESSRKIYNPRSVVTLSTGDVFVLCDASNYKAAKISNYSDVTLVFGNNSLGVDRLDNPKKIIRGNQLDIWILDKASNEILNYNNFGIFNKKLSPQDSSTIISIAYYNDNLFIFNNSGLIIYDLKKGQYSNFYRYPYSKQITDVTIFDKSTIVILTKNKFNKYSFN
jgi:hypothetical protein